MGGQWVESGSSLFSWPKWWLPAQVAPPNNQWRVMMVSRKSHALCLSWNIFVSVQGLWHMPTEAASHVLRRSATRNEV